MSSSLLSVACCVAVLLQLSYNYNRTILTARTPTDDRNIEIMRHLPGMDTIVLPRASRGSKRSATLLASHALRARALPRRRTPTRLPYVPCSHTCGLAACARSKQTLLHRVCAIAQWAVLPAFLQASQKEIRWKQLMNKATSAGSSYRNNLPQPPSREKELMACIASTISPSARRHSRSH